MDWQRKARNLADDLKAASAWLAVMSVWLWFEVDGWASVGPVLGALAAVGVLRGARIKP